MSKIYLVIIVSLLGVWGSGCVVKPATTPQYSFEQGCYVGFLKACQGPTRLDCLNAGLVMCPKYSQNFQAWIDAGKPTK